MHCPSLSWQKWSTWGFSSFFLWWRDKAENIERRMRHYTRVTWNLKKETWLQSVLCWLDILCSLGAPEPPGRVCVSLKSWWLRPRKMTSCAAVTIGLDQDKQLCFKIIHLPPLHGNFHFNLPKAHLDLLALSSIFPSQVIGPERHESNSPHRGLTSPAQWCLPSFSPAYTCKKN